VASPPTGTLTFLFTDIEGSTKLWENDPEAMQASLARHDEILAGAIEERGGYVFKTVGDAFCATFATAPDALGAALEAQRGLVSSEWEQTGPLTVRMALHTGVVEERNGDYFGPPVNRVARLLSAAHGGQVLISAATHEMVRDRLPAGAILRDLGERRLKDLFRPERVFQLAASGLPSAFPPLRTLDAYRNNLPLQPTPLIGREKEVAQVRDLLRGEETRLLTLTGPGGTGKTRVALQAAADLLEEFPDGAFFVSLAALGDPDRFISAVAETLGVKETGEQPLKETLKDYLGERRMLLVLDNFEQVLEAAPAVTELLSAAPYLKVLATSRTPLGLYGEHEFPVPPLTTPDLRHPPPLEHLTQYEAVGLFVERARAVKPDFSVTNESAPAVAEICVRLDGLPLAIELAAARIKMLPPNVMLRRLGSRLKLLTGGARDLPERQRTLRGAIEWSHALLDEGERVLFSRLAVFSGGRTLEAIDAICDAEGDLPVGSFEGVSSLLDKSLLRQEEGPQEEPRFVMLETIHEYAREKLEGSGEAEQIKRVHAEYFLAVAEEAEPRLRGAAQLEWRERLEAEHDNLRAALSWSLGGRDADLGLRLAGMLSWFWIVGGHLSEGRRWLEEALMKGREAPPRARAKALWGLGYLASLQGDQERGRSSLGEALALYRELEDKKGIANSLCDLGWIEMFRGAHERAKALLEEGLAVARESGDQWTIGFALNRRALSAHEEGDLKEANALWEEALRLYRKLGDTERLRSVLTNMAYAECVLGNHERAQALAGEALALNREMSDTLGEAIGLLVLGIAKMQGGELERAGALLEESLALHRELGLNRDVAECLEAMAEVAGGLGEERRAARLWGAAGALREATDNPWLLFERKLHEPYLAAARSRMEEAEWGEGWEEGRAMILDEAISYALEGEEEASG
jgi:predicted ATPase/class 3 adenylate cyclase/Tfp pilus assembly protein PilF